VTTDAPETTAATATTDPPATTTTEPPPPPEEPFDVSLASLVGRPAETNSLNGGSVSPVDGTVYVASVGGNEITVHDPETGEILDRIGPERGVNGPDDVFVADDGTVYWTDLLAGNVGMLTPDGEFKTQMVGPGVNPITMSDDGRLFVARIFLGDGLYEIDPMLEADPIPLDETLAGLNAFDFGPDGLLYAPSFFSGDVLRIDVDAVPIAPEVVASGFAVTSSVKFNSVGEAHVVNLKDGQVFKLDLAGGDHEMLLDIDGTIDNMSFDNDDRLFVFAGNDNQIIRIDEDGVTELGELGIGLPGGVAVSPDGTAWLAELFVMRGYDDDGAVAASFYDSFAEPGTGFAGAATVSVDGDNLILANTFAGSVQLMDPATGDILQDVRTVVIPTNAIRHGDRIVATQAGAGNVVNIDDLDDVLIADLALPTGLASDGTTLYVSDWATGDVWAIDEAGPRVLAAGLAQPEGLAVDGDRLLVVETGIQQVTAIDLASGETAPVITGLDYSASPIEGFLPNGTVSGVAIGPDGDIYVSDDGVNSLYRFERPAAPQSTRGLATQGQMTARCSFGLGAPSPETGRIRASQECTVSADGPLPIDPEQNLFIEFLDDGPTPTFGDPIIGFGDEGHVYGGYVTNGGDGRFVSSVLGAGDYAGEVIHIVGHSPGGGVVVFDWYVGDGPQPFGASGDFDETVEIGIECVPTDVPADAAGDVTSAETCTYTSDDARFSTAPSTDVIRTIDAGENGAATGSISYYNATTDEGVVRGGLVDDDGVRRWAGVVDGLGDVDAVVHEVGWAQTDENGVTSGVMLMSFDSGRS
jgi:sugar lactone lactonase YvrE